MSTRIRRLVLVSSMVAALIGTIALGSLDSPDTGAQLPPGCSASPVVTNTVRPTDRPRTTSTTVPIQVTPPPATATATIRPTARPRTSPAASIVPTQTATPRATATLRPTARPRTSPTVEPTAQASPAC